MVRRRDRGGVVDARFERDHHTLTRFPMSIERVRFAERQQARFFFQAMRLARWAWSDACRSVA